MPWDEDFETYAGTRLFIIPQRPSDDTETAWEAAMANAHEITITSVPNYRGREYSTATLSVVSNGRDRQKKGTHTLPTMDWGIQWLPEQAGQIDAQAALLDYSIPGFAVVDQNEGVSYFSAQVANLTESGGGGNDARAGTLTLLRQSDTLNAATPVVPTEDITP